MSAEFFYQFFFFFFVLLCFPRCRWTTIKNLAKSSGWRWARLIQWTLEHLACWKSCTGKRETIPRDWKSNPGRHTEICGMRLTDFSSCKSPLSYSLPPPPFPPNTNWYNCRIDILIDLFVLFTCFICLYLQRRKGLAKSQKHISAEIHETNRSCETRWEN